MTRSRALVVTQPRAKCYGGPPAGITLDLTIPLC